MVDKRVALTDSQEALAVLGRNDEHLRLLMEEFDCRVMFQDGELVVNGEPEAVNRLIRLLQELLFLHREGNQLTTHDVRYGIRMVKEDRADDLRRMFADTVIVTARGRHIKPKTLGQRLYLEAIRKSDVSIGIGPAGTGKTYLAVAMAVAALRAKQVERIILTRPAVEAGEKLGFLPGDLQEKVDPYLRPLYDAMYDIMGVDTFQKHMTRSIIEVAPLAYMRGRTLDDSFIILDEAQNTTPEQMKMFLTRMGFGSKIVVTGDVTQVDLPHGAQSGLRQIQTVLANIPGIRIVLLDERDVVRHEIVSRIIRAYETFEQDVPAE